MHMCAQASGSGGVHLLRALKNDMWREAGTQAALVKAAASNSGLRVHDIDSGHWASLLASSAYVFAVPV